MIFLKRNLILVLLLGMFLGFEAQAVHPLKFLPVQDGGRVKPFDTFARETLTLIYGRSRYKKKSAAEVVFTWPLFPEVWQKEKLLRIRSSQLRKSLNLKSEGSLFSLVEIIQNPHFQDKIKKIESLRAQGQKLEGQDKEMGQLEHQVSLLYTTFHGESIRLAPLTDPQSTWLSLKQILEKETKKAKAMTDVVAAFSRYTENPSKELEEKIKAFQKEVGTDRYQNKIVTEVWFYQIDPFFWALMAYILGLILFYLYPRGVKPVLALGFLLHTMGFIIRIYLTGRAPVTNMYETVVWVPWGAMLFGFILARFKRDIVFLKSAVYVSVVCLFIAELAPSILDPSLQPLEPVLRDNFWLTTHVLSLTLSYGAFSLAWFLANMALFKAFFFKVNPKSVFLRASQQVYDILKIGVLLLALGIFLGGVWADYSWGRFWGWDPKETWALIALLGYLALLHGRISGWIKPFGVLMASIINFSLVIMTWYGVNFVLGQGLHSYGFGSGGFEVVASCVAVQFLWLIYLSLHKKKMIL